MNLMHEALSLFTNQITASLMKYLLHCIPIVYLQINCGAPQVYRID